jgi:hypothetical protein
MVVAISSSPILRGAPVLVIEPIHTLSEKRLYQVPTVCAQTPSFSAILLFFRPLAAASMIRTRSAIACGALPANRRRTRIISVGWEGERAQSEPT